MADPMMVAVAAAVAGKITEATVPGAKTALGNLIKLVKTRLARKSAAQAALIEAEQAPSDPNRVAALAAELEQLAGEDPQFAEMLRGAWSQASVHLHAERGGTINEVSGTVSGHSVQAHKIEGGIRFGAVDDN